MERLYETLKREMFAQQVTASQLAGMLGKTDAWMSNRMRGKVAWEIDNCYAALDCLGIEESRIHDFFPRSGRVSRQKNLPVAARGNRFQERSVANG